MSVTIYISKTKSIAIIEETLFFKKLLNIVPKKVENKIIQKIVKNAKAKY
jgi:hypothetical protein